MCQDPLTRHEAKPVIKGEIVLGNFIRLSAVFLRTLPIIPTIYMYRAQVRCERVDPQL